MKKTGIAMWLVALGVLVVGAVAAQEPAQSQKDSGALETSATEPAIEPPVAAAKELDKQATAELPAATGAAKGEKADVKPLPPEEALPYAELLKDFTSGGFWLTLLVALVCGSLGGVVYELLILQGNIELPHPANKDEASAPFPHALSRNLLDLGVWARVIIGGLAAVAAVWILSPATGLGLVAGAIVAGSAGISVFRSLQDRLLATLAQKDAADVRATAEQQVEKVTQALAKVTEARGAAAPVEKLVVKPSGSALTPGTTHLEDAERLLTEARAIGEILQRKRPVQ